MTLLSSERATPQRAKLEDTLVVDTDVHVWDLPKDLMPYIEMPWLVYLESIQNKTGGSIPGFAPGSAGSHFSPMWPSGHEKGRMVLTPEAMRRELTHINVDIGILFPHNLLQIAILTDDAYAAALARAFNAWLVDVWCRPEEGLLGVVVACPQAPEDAAAEIEKYAKHPGMVGVYLPSSGVEPLWGHRKYDPIYRAAEAAGFPVLLHSVGVVHPAYPFNTHAFSNVFGRHLTGHTFSMMANLVDMVTTGVSERFPNLRIAYEEAGVSWVPFLAMRMDRIYRDRPHEAPLLTKLPSQYMKDFYYATQPIEEPQNLRDLVTLIDLFHGEDRTVFASDWPHHDFDHPNKLFQAPFSDEAKRKILGGNALRHSNIDARGQRLDLVADAPS